MDCPSLWDGQIPPLQTLEGGMGLTNSRASSKDEHPTEPLLGTLPWHDSREGVDHGSH